MSGAEDYFIEELPDGDKPPRLVSSPDYPKLVSAAIGDLGVWNDAAHLTEILQHAMRMVEGKANPAAVRDEIVRQRRS